MIEVFTTNIPNTNRAKGVIHKLKTKFPNSEIHFDIEGEVSNYPCTHSIIRFEDTQVPSVAIRSLVIQEGYRCDVLIDKVCY
ncbi:hypothetical protein [Pseudotamlana agarivorans]|uniref:hypothetical protein n=1 Tax=Pseudotamlana agarivorans TaxID=481183 RepID=UPI0008360E5C|nr:hypothetical protein [Tamlana agarivorans]